MRAKVLRRLGLVCCCWAVAPWPSGALGQDAPSPDAEAPQVERNDEEARVHFRLGRAYYQSGRFDQAANEFELAYKYSGRPQLLYNVFLARRDAGQIGRAIEALETYLALVPEAPERDALTARLASMKRLSEQQGGGGGSASGDGGGSEPRDEASRGGQPDPERVDEEPLDAGEGVEPVMDVDVHGKRHVIAWTVLGVGGGLLVGGVITGVLALRQEKELENACEGTSGCPDGFESDADRGKMLATVTDVLLATGIAAVGAGIALYFLLDEDTVERAPTRPDSPTASIGCGPRGCMGTVRLGF